MNCFELLDLDDGADEREIKRAYARAIKQTRPDEDAAGFQRLNEAYQQALQWAAMRRQEEEAESERDTAVGADTAGDTDHRQAPEPVAVHVDVATLRPAEVYASADGTQEVAFAAPGADRVFADTTCDGDARLDEAGDAASAAHAEVVAGDDSDGEEFDFGEFYQELLFRGSRDRASDLRAWLYSLGPLYNFELKDHVAHHVRYWLVHDEDTTPLRSANLDVVAEFFGFETGSGLAAMNAARWAVFHEDTSHYGEPRPAVIRQLKRPYHFARALGLAMVPGWSARMAALGRRLSQDYGELPPGIDPRQFELARLLSSASHLGGAVWLVLLGRALFAACALWLLMVPFMLAATRDDTLQRATIWSLALGSGVFAGGALWCGVRWLRQVHAHADQGSPLYAAAMPLVLALVGTTLSLLLAYALPGLLVSGIAMALAARHWHRTWDALRMTVAGLWTHSALTAGGFDGNSFSFGVGFGALTLLACDIAYARRHDLPLSAAVASNPWTMTVSYVLFAAALVLRQGLR